MIKLSQFIFFKIQHNLLNIYLDVFISSSIIIDYSFNLVHIYSFWGPINLFHSFGINFKQDDSLSSLEEA